MFKKEDEYAFLNRISANCQAIDTEDDIDYMEGDEGEERELPEIEDFDSKADRLYEDWKAKDVNKGEI